MRENEYKNWYTKKDVEMRTGIVDDWINELRDIHKCSTYKNHITQNGALFIWLLMRAIVTIVCLLFPILIWYHDLDLVLFYCFIILQ